MTPNDNVRPVQKLETLVFGDGEVYNGEVEIIEDRKVRSGKGIMNFFLRIGGRIIDEMYEGEWKNDNMSGHGVYKYATGAKYDGEWLDNKHHGKGLFLFADGSYYEGEWNNHKMHGQGIYVDCRGDVWEGIFSEGKYSSAGQVELKNQARVALLKQAKVFSAKEWLTSIIAVFEGDKKSQKESFRRLTTSEVSEEVALLMKTHPVKFEDKKADQW